MTNSQNGWPINPSSVTTLLVSGVNCGGVRSGDVFTVMEYVATRFHREVMPLRAGQCGGYNPRHIAGSTFWSNHASATANDFNWNLLPEGHRSMSPGQRMAANRIEDDCGGVVRWGGNYPRSDVDEMHWEINATASAVAALAKTIKEDHMTPAEMDQLADKVVAKLKPLIPTVGDVWAAGFGPGTARETAGERLGHIDQAVDDILDRLAMPTPGVPTNPPPVA